MSDFPVCPEETRRDETEVLRTGLTAEGFYYEGDPDRRSELVSGCELQEPIQSFGHGATAAHVTHLLAQHLLQHPVGGIALGECGFIGRRNPDTVRGPDAAYVGPERLAAWSGQGPFFEGAPDLAVEVLSPSNTRAGMAQKVEEYLSAGGRQVWVLDPKARNVVVHRPDGVTEHLGADDVLDADGVLPGFRVQVSDLLGTAFASF